jgi:hypothetical protein
MGEVSRPEGIFPPERRTPEESSIQKPIFRGLNYFLKTIFWIIFHWRIFSLIFPQI